MSPEQGRPLRIGVALRTWGHEGGIGVYTRHLVRAMLELDRTNEYCLFYPEPGHLGALAEFPNVREFHVRAPNRLWWDQISLPWAARRQNVDIIFHTKFSVPLLSGRRTAMVVHGTEHLFYPQYTARGHRFVFNHVFPIYLKKASVILAVAERGRQDIIEHLGVPPDKVVTTNLAYNPSFRRVEDPRELERVQAEYGLPRRYILNVGHIYPGKNIGRLIRALARVREEHDVDLVVAGGYRFGQEKELRPAAELGIEEHVHVTGPVSHEDLAAMYSLAELVAFPSIYESFPAIPLEAQACDCPVVTSPTGGTPESAGEAAEYVDPLDVEDIARGIRAVLDDPALRRDLVERGRQNIRRFSWPQTARRSLEALRSAATQ